MAYDRGGRIGVDRIAPADHGVQFAVVPEI
jgi:hypothetical protein